MDFQMSHWQSSSDAEFWRQWAIHSAGELSFLAGDHEVDDWREKIRQRLVELLNIAIPHEPPDHRLVGQRDMTTFSIQKIEFPGAGGAAVSGFVCIPHDNEEPLPAVLCTPPAGYTPAGVCGLLNIHDPETAFGAKLAADGYVVVCMDRRGHGERRSPLYDEMLGDAARMPAVGRDALDLMIAGLILRDRPDVEDRRTGIIGFDRGGAAALYASAVDERFYAAALCGCIARYRSLPLAPDRRAEDALMRLLRGTIPPGLLQWADFEDIATLVAPRQLLLYHAGGDIPTSIAEDAARRVTEGYTRMGEKIRMETEITGEPAQYPGDRVLQFLEDWLRLPVRDT
jgi:pimeloyl-ACP methyl ester carboxylesterase